MSQNTDRISIQVGLSGYSFKIQTADEVRTSPWMSAERIFSTPEFLQRYDKVEISVFTPKVTLVPDQFNNTDDALRMLSPVADVQKDDEVTSISVPEFAASLVYSNNIGETLSRAVSETVMDKEGNKSTPLPEMYFMLRSVLDLQDYNKILASYMDGVLYLVIAQGRSLLLCNSFHAPDFTTAQYFIFLALKNLQLNPEVSTICFRTPLTDDEEMSLYRYFKNVELV
ncbi:MAG: DUF3822 family protein [Bacteroidales bacterium]|nr:DUF3822 family protein [Bacteroidales bacterium]MBQ9722311.1 DUF3822 family protein [Bacteroidales bacterium]